MPICVAVGCNNRSDRGFTMKCFPREEKIKKIWLERISIPDFKPAKNSVLCHTHFDADQWTITTTGRIKLKRNAIPSIFPKTAAQKTAAKRQKRKSGNNDTEDLYIIEYLGDPGNCKTSSEAQNTIYDSYTTSNVTTKIGRKLQGNTSHCRSKKTTMENAEGVIVISDEETSENLKCVPDGNVSGEKLEEKIQGTDEGPKMDQEIAKIDATGDTQDPKDPPNPTNSELSIEKKNIDAEEKTEATPVVNETENPSTGETKENPQSLENGSVKEQNKDKPNRKRASSLENPENSEKTALEVPNPAKKPRQDAAPTRCSTFTIKLTGTDEDVTEIVEGLGTEPIMKYQSGTESSNSNRSFVTSVISITDKTPIKSAEEDEGAAARMEGDSDRESDEEKLAKMNGNSPKTSGRAKLSDDSSNDEDTNDLDKLSRKRLIEKIKLQEDVIQKLTESIKEKSVEASSENTNKKAQKQNNVSSDVSNGQYEPPPDTLIFDLTERLNRSNETNRNLIKNLLDQQRNAKKVKMQLRQRDKRVKELTWKLSKASTYIDRAEKNAITYRKKMMTLQNVLKSQKYHETVEAETNQSETSVEKTAYLSQNTGNTDETETNIQCDELTKDHVTYKTVQHIFEESNICDEPLLIDTPEEFLRLFGLSQ